MLLPLLISSLSLLPLVSSSPTPSPSPAWLAGVIIPPVVLIIGLMFSYFYYRKIHALVEEAKALNATVPRGEERRVGIRDLMNADRGVFVGGGLPLDELDAGEVSAGSSGTGNSSINKTSSRSRSSLTLPPTSLAQPLPFSSPNRPKPKSKRSLSGNLGSIVRSREVVVRKDGKRVLGRKPSSEADESRRKQLGRTRRRRDIFGTGEREGEEAQAPTFLEIPAKGYYSSSASLTPPSLRDFRETVPRTLSLNSESSILAPKKTPSYGSTTAETISPPVVSFAALTPPPTFSPQLPSASSRTTPTISNPTPNRGPRWSSADFYSDQGHGTFVEDENRFLIAAAGRATRSMEDEGYFINVKNVGKMYGWGLLIVEVVWGFRRKEG